MPYRILLEFARIRSRMQPGRADILAHIPAIWLLTTDYPVSGSCTGQNM
ncbi:MULTISPECIES: hypothetical protein [Nitrosospira]|nr:MULTISPECIES: hypothetical protein [Nitrosospira]